MIKHIYIHIPFCIKKCGYCNFYSVTCDNDIKQRYIAALTAEIKEYLSKYDIAPETIYFGGGTPSLINSDSLYNILSLFPQEKIKETTIEVNPATIGINDIKKLKEVGFNRISIGAQSTQDSELKMLGRLHSSADLSTLYNKGLKEIFNNISLDMIYGLPDQNMSSVEATLHNLLDLSPNHISIYCLSLEGNVPLKKLASHIPSDETLSNMYHNIRAILSDEGFTQYELSNFCTGGQVSLHNLCYWTNEQYLGLGANASGYIQEVRYQNSELSDYLKGNYVAEMYKPSAEDTEKEYIITALRLASGISLQNYEERFHAIFTEKYSGAISHLTKNGLIEVDDTIRIKPEYYFLSNEVLCEFV